MPVRHLLGALDGGLKGDSPGNFWVLGSYASKTQKFPGDYTLTLQFADGLHRSYGEDLSATINIKVAAR